MNVNFEPIIRGLKSGIFDWDETDFTLGLCRSQLQKKRSGVKKCLEIMTIRGGRGRRLMEKTILNLHFDYLTAPLMRQFLPLAKSIFLISIIRTGRWSRPSFTSQGPLYLGALLGVLGYPELPISILDLVEPCDDFLPFWFCTNLGSVFSFDLTLLKSLLPPSTCSVHW